MGRGGGKVVLWLQQEDERQAAKKTKLKFVDVTLFLRRKLGYGSAVGHFLLQNE